MKWLFSLVSNSVIPWELFCDFWNKSALSVPKLLLSDCPSDSTDDSSIECFQDSWLAVFTMACHLMQQIFLDVQVWTESVSNVVLFFFPFLIKFTQWHLYSHRFHNFEYCSVSSLFMKLWINANKELLNWDALAWVCEIPKVSNDWDKKCWVLNV